MSSGAGLNNRPILGPVLYGASTLAAGMVSYIFGWLFTESPRAGLGWALVADGVLLLYLAACSLSGEKEGKRT